MNNKLILVIMFFLCINNITGFSLVQPTQTCPTIGLQDSSLNWLVLSITGVFLVFMIAVCVFLIGKAVDLPNISAWGKNEIWQVSASFILIVLLLALIGPLDQIGKLNNPSCQNVGDCDVTLCGYSDPSDPNAGCTLLQTAYYYSEAMAAELMHLGYHMLTINMFLEGLFSIEINFTPFNMIGINYDFGSMFGIVSKLTDWSLVILLPAITSWIGNMFILCFTSDKMLALFLPLGLILRSFPTTRSVGGGLIALALGLYFVYPIMLNLNNLIMSAYIGVYPYEMINYAQDHFYAFPPTLNRPGREITNAIIDPLYKSFKEFMTSGTPTIFKNRQLLYPMVAGAISDLYMDAFYIMLQEGIFLVMIGSFILPSLNIFITFTFIQEMGKFLGSDMNVAELVKLI